jgi:hypothetical protein
MNQQKKNITGAIDMKALIVLLLLVPVLSFGQLFKSHTSQILFAAGADTVAEHDSQDTVAVRIGTTAGWGPYINLAKEINSDGIYISAAEKSAETNNVYNLAAETWWTYAEKIQVRITSPSVVVTSKVCDISGLEGAVTLFIDVDTVTTNTYTDYGASLLIGF